MKSDIMLYGLERYLIGLQDTVKNTNIMDIRPLLKTRNLEIMNMRLKKNVDQLTNI